MTRSAVLVLLLAGCSASGSAPDAGVPASVPPVSLAEVRPGVWVHTSWQRLAPDVVFPANGLVLADGDGLLLVDSAWGEDNTVALLDSIDAQIGRPVRRAVVTHFHDDRVSGADVLRARGVDVYATPLTRRLARAEGNAVPEHALDGLAEPGAVVRFGSADVLYPGAGHTADNLVVHARGVVFGGCSIHEASRTTAGNTADADLAEWPASLRRVRAAFPDADLVVPGHGSVGRAALIEHSIRLVEIAAEEALGG